MEHLPALRLICLIAVFVVNCASIADAAPQRFDIIRDRAVNARALQNQPVAEPAAVVRSRSVAVDVQALSAMEKGDVLTLRLFADVTLDAVIIERRKSGPQTIHWTGRLADDPDGSVLLVLHQGALAGIVRLPNVADYRIRSSAGRGQIVEQLDPAQFMPSAVLPAEGMRPGGEPQGATRGAGCLLIDIMIVYTAEARIAEGGTAAIQAIAYLAVDETNFAFENSLIECRTRLVYTGEVDYVESGNFFTEIARLQDPADGFMDEVHLIRDGYGADAVDLLVSHTQGGTICGVGYLMSPVSASFDAYAFSVCNTGCAAGGYTFAHELGHNMGCHHDRENAGGQAAFDFSYGYRFTGDDAQLYRTVMAYAPGNRIPYFSNPDVLYQGQPTGLPEGHTNPNGEPDSADNARTINLTAETVAAFRFIPPGSGGPQEPHLWSPPSILQPEELAAGDRFGCSVAMDGDLAIIGAFQTDLPGQFGTLVDAGAAYIYRYDPTTNTWVQQGERLTAGNDAAAGNRFGDAVAIVNTSDGTDFAVVGAYLADSTGAKNSGKAYIFRGSAGGWIQEGDPLRPEDLVSGDSFSRSVAAAASPMGDVIVVGAHFHDNGGPLSDNRGAAYVFRYGGLGWQQEAKLMASNAAFNDQFGISVALKVSPLDGSEHVLVGALNGDGPTLNSGTAYVFRSKGGGWTEAAILSAPDAGSNHLFGVSVALDITSEGKVAIIGSRRPYELMSGAGAAYIFRDLGGKEAWQYEATLTSSSPGTNDRFGHHVAVLGNVALVGAYLDDANPDMLDTGAAYFFRKSGGSWAQEARLITPAQHAAQHFAFRVALTQTGDSETTIRAAMGAVQRWRDENTTLVGAVYFSENLPLDDCNQNGVSDICDIIYETSTDLNNNGIPDECEADCNNNGVPDDLDISSGTSLDLNGNGIPDECENGDQCPADINHDGAVNVSDLLAVINSWGACPAPPATCPADIAPIGPPQGDGVVNVSDLLMVINNWGACPP